jgi:hypothetical protein
LTGERAGQPLNRENDASRVPTFFLCVNQHRMLTLEPTAMKCMTLLANS